MPRRTLSEICAARMSEGWHTGCRWLRILLALRHAEQRFRYTSMKEAAVLEAMASSPNPSFPPTSPPPRGCRRGAADRPALGHEDLGAVKALANFNASIAPGEFVTVIGPSGCGKSTLFNIVAGLEEPDAGGVLRFKGRSCHAADLLGQVSFMPQRDLLLPWRTVIDNAILALEIEGKPRKEARAEALRMLPEFGLSGFENQYPHQLSGGMRQRVALMRTFLFERDLILLDEPFGALDALTRMMMQRWLLDIWRRHQRTILFITHDVDEAIFLGDRVLAMTARPGGVKLEQRIDLPRPRRPELVTSPRLHPPQAHPARCHRGGEHQGVPDRQGDPVMSASLAPAEAAGRYGTTEWEARVALAACYRMVAKLGMDDLIYNHISARVPGREDAFLINPYGLLFDEIDASSLVKIDIDGNILDDTPHTVNLAAFVIHAAIHKTSHEAACVLHTHSDASVAVSGQEKGLLPLSQFAMRFYDRQAFHDYEGVAIDLDEQERLVRDLGPHKVMLMRNHGILTVGRTPGEAFMLLYYFERAARIQLAMQAAPPRAPPSSSRLTTSASVPPASSGSSTATS